MVVRKERTSPLAGPEVYCECGAWILFGSLATEEEKLHPTCLDCEEALKILVVLRKSS